MRHAGIYAGEEVVVTLGKQKDSRQMKTKTKMSTAELVALPLYNARICFFVVDLWTDRLLFVMLPGLGKGGCLNNGENQMKH